MSSTPVPKQKTRRAPGAATCSAVAAPRNSATPWASEPARVTGDVAPAMAMEYTLTGAPCRARAMWQSSAGPSHWSGLAFVSTVETRGRSRNASRLPAAASQTRTDGLRVVRRIDERDVLARLGEQREVLDQLALFQGHVRRRHLRPHHVELGKLVVEPRRLAEILQRARAAHAGAEVQRLGDAPAGREVERLTVVEDDVVLRRRAGEQHPPRALGKRPLDELARQARDARALVHLRAPGRQFR